MHSLLLPRNLGLTLVPPPEGSPGARRVLEVTGESWDRLRRRWEGATAWLRGQFSADQGAVYGFYRVEEGTFEPPQTVNLIAPMQFLAQWDLTPDPELLHMARACADWLEARMVEHHPMSVVQGGVRDGDRPEVWVKYAAEYVLLNLALWERGAGDFYRTRAVRSGRFLVQARRHGFASRYHLAEQRWRRRGWWAFGRAVLALLALREAEGGEGWEHEALAWGEEGLRRQAPDGGFYLLDGEYWNSDLAADPLRALVSLHGLTGERRWRDAAVRFADWLLARQAPDGSWPLTVDRDGNVVCDTVGPGDVPHLGMALLVLYRATGEPRYEEAAVRALGYSLRVQVTPEDPQYGSDPRVRWGFWSWQPRYDATMSGDQSTFHARGLMVLAAHLAGSW